ncbi:MAG: EAL domain-containing protein [Candidatus Accumulibacter sp.]|uniref:EAL domain-containing protein n=1 Tax=Accumulibacter sp. TaxID=2053492 RepID=UPI0019EC257F|nr:EAL domain-containing protein [Accumulibacter sp.]MBE2258829.1 EAL domain-containing protein [Paracoccaceae bacterium]MCB1941313.1 EAL domain-containing protein [Accumulibacter sp.]MCP5248567.1 EAL domain-containing protein [Accumulibacter sp.]
MTLPSPELNAIHQGLQAGEFFVEYLPLVSLNDRACLGGEALTRWRRPAGEIILPGQFIPLIENTPLSGVLTYWLIDTLAVEVGAWLSAHPEARLSFNVPPEILGRGGLEYAAAKSGLSALRTQIVLEVTERGIPDQLGLMALNTMYQGGIRLALDDVTMTGANLALISRCDFHIIKIDRTLTAQITAECPHPDWLRSLAGLLHAADLTVIAEGIETPVQFEALAAAGVQLGQGYLFSRPLAAGEFIAYYTGNAQAAASPQLRPAV